VNVTIDHARTMRDAGSYQGPMNVYVLMASLELIVRQVWAYQKHISLFY